MKNYGNCYRTFTRREMRRKGKETHTYGRAHMHTDTHTNVLYDMFIFKGY